MNDSGENPKDRLGALKPPLTLVPPAAIIVGSKVMGLGAKKYGPYNWRQKKVKYTVYLEAAMRHILSALDGEELDPESGQPHVGHAFACMAILLDAKATGNLVDDRPTPGVAGRLIADLTEKAGPLPTPPLPSLDEINRDLARRGDCGLCGRPECEDAGNIPMGG